MKKIIIFVALLVTINIYAQDSVYISVAKKSVPAKEVYTKHSKDVIAAVNKLDWINKDQVIVYYGKQEDYEWYAIYIIRDGYAIKSRLIKIK